MIEDHCTGWFEGWWAEACRLHDIAYATGASRAEADWALLVGVASSFPAWASDYPITAAAASAAMAATMWVGVRVFGGPFWRRAKRMTHPPMPMFWPASSGLLFIGPQEPSHMAADNFDAVMEHIFRSEGGYVNHKDDPGGATNMGITIGTLSDHLGRRATIAEVKALSKETARAIYRARYWAPSSCDNLPAGVDFCVMDAAVNSGPGRAAKWLQRAVGAEADGKIGTKTLAATETVAPSVIIERMCDDRLAFLKRLPTWSAFGKGWGRRVSEVRSAALAMAGDTADDASPPIAPVPPIAPPKPPSKPLDIGRYSKMVGSLIGAVLAWAATQNLVPDGLISAEQIDTLAVIVGGVIGTFLAPKNAEA